MWLWNPAIKTMVYGQWSKHECSTNSIVNVFITITTGLCMTYTGPQSNKKGNKGSSLTQGTVAQTGFWIWVASLSVDKPQVFPHFLFRGDGRRHNQILCPQAWKSPIFVTQNTDRQISNKIQDRKKTNEIIRHDIIHFHPSDLLLLYYNIQKFPKFVEKPKKIELLSCSLIKRLNKDPQVFIPHIKEPHPHKGSYKRCTENWTFYIVIWLLVCSNQNFVNPAW